jgi:DNA-binding NarL/FixJ family response regulator
MKLLIVEDNPSIRQIMRFFLSDLTEEISECEDAADAFTAYSRLLPDWVLMDIKMKQINGLTATAEIKAAYPDAKIVIVTSFDNKNLREKAVQAGACGYVLKENLLDLRKLLIG